jgi:hypothetical protein
MQTAVMSGGFPPALDARTDHRSVRPGVAGSVVASVIPMIREQMILRALGFAHVMTMLCLSR